MTVASTNSYDPLIATIIKDAMVAAGLMNTRQSITDANHKDNALYCYRLLADLVDSLIARDVILRWTEFRTLTLTSGTSEYSLGSDVQDVLGALMYQSTSGSGETHVSQISDTDWDRLSDKTSTGTPSLALVYKAGDPITIRFWPIPDTTSATVRYKAHVAPADSTDGSKTLDMPRYWRRYLTKQVAADFAGSQGLEAKSQKLMMEAEAMFRANMNKSQSRASRQAYIGHGGQYMRGR